jgi:hypothetical protein
MLQFDLAEGFGSRHRDMLQIQFSDEPIDAILNYLGGLSEVAASNATATAGAHRTAISRAAGAASMRSPKST